MAVADDTPPLLDVRDLTIAYGEGGGGNRVVHGVSFRIRAGETVALVGESGSGKTTAAQSIIGLLPSTGRLEGGRILLNGTDIAGWSQRRLDAVRGTQISLIPQDPASSLNPVRTIGAQLGEVFRLHQERDRRAIEARVVELLGRVGLTQPKLRARQYPHELSGGMRQRVLIAMAVALKPQLIIADEPTSALDVTVQRRILDLIDMLRQESGTAVLLVTHDLGVAADRSDHVIVMQGGRIQEQGPSARVLMAPSSAYTRRLLSDAPALAPARPRAPRPDIAAVHQSVIVEHLVQEFALSGGKTFRAVDDVSFRVARGTTHAIVGESGSGKTTTVRAIMGFGAFSAGRIAVCGMEVGSLPRADAKRFRRRIQMVYQNPFGSLDPRQSIAGIIEEPLLNFEPVPREERRRKVAAMLDRVHLPRATLERTPRALSGGQRQRVAIARALVLDPEVVVLDEAVSALDVTVQAQILALLEELQAELGLTYLFVSHDLAVVRQISDTVSVLHHGRQVDSGPVEQVFRSPGSPYTQELINAIPGRSLHRPGSPASGSLMATP